MCQGQGILSEIQSRGPGGEKRRGKERLYSALSQDVCTSGFLGKIFGMWVKKNGSKSRRWKKGEEKTIEISSSTGNGSLTMSLGGGLGQKG